MKLKPFLQFTGIMLLSLLLRYPWRYLNNTIFYIFQERDILRAQELLAGNPIFFGPEVTGGGFLPGPFYYYLLMPPLSLGLGWMGVWGWMLLLLSLGGAIGWSYINKKFGAMTAFLWLVLYSVNFTTTQMSLAFINPSFSFLFVTVINVLVLQAFTEEDQKTRNRSFILACFITGLAIQLHYSVGAYLFALIFLKVFSKQLKLASPEDREFGAGLGLFVLAITPFLIWVSLKSFGIEIGQEAWLGGNVRNSLPSLLEHFKTAFSVPKSEFFLAAVLKLFLITPVAVIVFGFISRFIPEANSAAESPALKSLVKVLLVTLSFTLIPFSFYFFVPQGSRYGAPTAATIGFLTAILFYKLLATKRGIRYFNVVGLGILFLAAVAIFLINPAVLNEESTKVFVILAFTGIASWFFMKLDKNITKQMILGFVVCSALFLAQALYQNHTRKELHKDGNMPQYWHWQKIISVIYSQTHWNYEEMTERLYFVNHHIEQAPLLAYDLFAYDVPDFAVNPPLKPDGYFVSIADPHTEKNLAWLLRQLLHDDIRTGLLNGGIRLGDFNAFDKVMIAPYFIENKAALPLHLNNLGRGYSKLKEEKLLRDLEFQNGVKKESEARYIFKWNECPAHHYYCDTGVIADIAKAANGFYDFNLRIVGMSLSQGSKWIAPDWTQAWIRPYLEVSCAGKNTKYQIISSVGFNYIYMQPESSFRYLLTNNSLLAPLQRSFRIKCPEGLTGFSIGREASEVERLTDFITLPPAKLTATL